MKTILLYFLLLICMRVDAQVMCYSNEADAPTNSIGPTKSISDLKIIRVNFHFMQNSSGGGNFRSYDDGNGS